MSHCLLILSDSGLPLYTRSSDKQSTSLPFSTSGLLSALHSSSSAQHFPISTLHTADATMHFIQQDHIVLLLASHTAQLQPHILARMSDCLTLIVGRKALQDDKQLQRLKRRMRHCTPMLDWWMQHNTHRGWDRLTGMPEWRMDTLSAAPWMSALLGEVSSQCGTRHVCLYEREKVVLPSSEYAMLHPHDLLSIAAYIATLSHHTSIAHSPAASSTNTSQPTPIPAQQSTAGGVHDQPIYLSHSTLHKRVVDGNTAYRLLVVPLLPSTSLSAVLLCGPSPSTERVEQSVGRAAIKCDEQLRQWGQKDTTEDAVSGETAAETGQARANAVLAGVVLCLNERCWSVVAPHTACDEVQQQLSAFYCTMAEDVSAADGQESYMLLRDGVVLYGMRRGEWQLFAALKAKSIKAAREQCQQLLSSEQKRYSELLRTVHAYN